MSNRRLHFEEFLYLPALTHEAVIIAWGGFFFEVTTDHDKEKWRLLDADETEKSVGRRETVGQKSKPYGSQARVEVTERGGGSPTVVFSAGANSAVVTGLKPDTAYEYRVMVTDETGVERQWAAGPLHDWVVAAGNMRPGGRYENTFRTFPDPTQATPSFAFAVIGDFGRGIRQPSADDRCQREVAEALIAAAERHDIRLMLTTGDNIYAKTLLGIPVSSSGDEDDDWFFTYFQPYRYLINRLPVFPTVGNHDAGENEESIDRDQIYDNFYLRTQFARLREPHESTLAHGLFYRFSFGRDVEFICLDTSKDDSGKRCFDLPENAPFLERVFADSAPLWRIAYSHHPAFCAGPRHPGSQSLRKFFKAHPEIRVSFSGHEHNFQYARDGGQHHFLTGGGGKFRTDAPSKNNIAAELCQAWGGNTEGHFLLVRIDGKRLEVTPYGQLTQNELRAIVLNPQTNVPFVVEEEEQAVSGANS